MEKLLEIYYTDIAALMDGAAFEEKLMLVNKQRRARVLRCKQQADKARSLAAGLLIRYGLERNGISYDSTAFDVDRFGKPCIVSDLNIHFNVSHSGDYVVCAFSSQEVGIDIECISKRFSDEKGEKRIRQVADRTFNDREQAYLDRFQEPERTEAFVKIWTRKEAYAKAYGEGIRMDFSRIDTMQEDLFYSKRLGEYWISAFLRNKAPIKMDGNKVFFEEGKL